MAHDHYKKDVSHLKQIDVYRVCDLFGVTQPALQHAVKKVLCAGQRGAKDYERDLREAVDSINRALQMHAEDCGATDIGSQLNEAHKRFSELHHKMFGLNQQMTSEERREYVRLTLELGVSVMPYFNFCAARDA